MHDSASSAEPIQRSFYRASHQRCVAQSKSNGRTRREPGLDNVTVDAGLSRSLKRLLKPADDAIGSGIIRVLALLLPAERAIHTVLPGGLTARIVQFSRHGEGHVMGRTDALEVVDAVLGMDIAP